MQNGIDFVVLWVDMDDPKWRADFEKFSGRAREDKNSVSAARFRDHGFLKYWFRGVEEFTPWVNKIHFVTCGQKPEWLDTSNPKLHLVDHKDYIPEAFLPCFNSGVLESFLHRIPGLSERFVFFNDDFFIISPTGKERFFQDGLPCDITAFRLNFGESQWNKMLKNNLRLINKHFNKRVVMARDGDKWFAPEFRGMLFWNNLTRWSSKFMTLRTPHNAQPYLRSTFEHVWEVCEAELNEAATHRFRTAGDLTQELFRTWQCCEGNFVPYNTYKDTKMFPLMIRSWQAIEALRQQKYKLVCLNDNVHITDYQRVMAELGVAFESILPKKSTFEK